MLETGTARDFETASNRVFYPKSIVIPSGTSEGQSDVRWSSHRFLDSFAEEDIDLTTLTGDLGQPLTFARLTGLILVSAPRQPKFDISHPTTNFGGIRLTRPTNGVPIFNAVGDSIFVIGRGMFAWIAHRGSPPGVAVTAGTGDLIHLTGGASQTTFDLHLFGTSA